MYEFNSLQYIISVAQVTNLGNPRHNHKCVRLNLQKAQVDESAKATKKIAINKNNKTPNNKRQIIKAKITAKRQKRS